jgi:hypothetical protein
MDVFVGKNEDYECDNKNNINWKKCDAITITEKAVIIILNSNSPNWGCLNTMRNVYTLSLYSHLNDYSFLVGVEQVQFLNVNCPDELLNSDKLMMLSYDPRIDFDKHPSLMYRFDKDVDNINPNIAHIYIKFRVDSSAKNILQQLKKFENIKSILVYSNHSDDADYFNEIKSEYVFFHIDQLDKLVGFNKHKIIESDFACDRDVVENNTVLIDGSFGIKGMNAIDSAKFLQEIFARNKRYCKTKSANKSV